MNMLETLIKEKGGELVSSLMKQGFDNTSAASLLRETGSSITSALASGKINPGTGSVSDMVAPLIGSIDIPALAAKIGINPEMAKSGLALVAPQLLKLLQQQLGSSEGVSSLLSGSAAGGDLLNMAKKLF